MISNSKDENEANEADPLVNSKADGSVGALLGFVDWFRKLKQTVGYELLVILFFTQHLNRGFVDNMAKQTEMYVYRKYHVPAPRMQVYQSITNLPWALKPVIGLISDTCPIAGYNKEPYMVVISMLGSLAFLAVGVLPQNVLPVLGVVICFFLANSETSTNDILTEAKYAEQIRLYPHIGPSILTYVWFGMQAGSIIALLLSGVLVDISPTLPYLICAFPAALVLAPLAFGYMQERKLNSEEVAAVRRRFAEEKEACFLSLLMLIICALLTFCGLISSDPLANSIVSLIGTIAMMGSMSVLLSPTIAKFACWTTLQQTLMLSTQAPGFYFYTDSKVEYPEGPHFSPVFYNSVVATAGAVISLIGIACYQRYMSTYGYRNLLVATNLAFSAMQCLDIVMFTRLNLWLGIPDHCFMLSTTALQNLFQQFQWMPQVVILSYLCPPGMEATMYALLAGCHNLGISTSSNFGALLLDLLSCRPNGSPNETEQFHRLWVASAISTVLPLIAVVLLYKLVPDVQQGRQILEPEQRSAVAGSLWRVWWGIDSATVAV